MKQLTLPKIGLRTLKTALAVFICLLLFPEEPFFACMTAIFCLQNTMTNSFKMAIVRGYGTFHGGMIGLFFLALCRVADHFLSNGYFRLVVINLIIASGIIIIIYTCNLIKQQPSIPIACIVFLGITTAHAYDAPFYYAIHRMMMTVGGLFVGILVNKYINPPKHH